MLTTIEKIIFIVLAAGCLGASYFTFRKMFQVIGIGQDQIDWFKVAKNWRVGINAFISQKTLFKTRPIVGFIHVLVAWGFSLYLLVNLIDVLYGLIPDFKFLPNHVIGDVYRIFVDIFSILVLLGVFYFLIRRFIQNQRFASLLVRLFQINRLTLRAELKTLQTTTDRQFQESKSKRHWQAAVSR